MQPKKLHHSKELDRRASWHELFFDLALVVPIYQLSHYLADHLSVTGIIAYLVMFLAVFQAWQHHVFFMEQFALPERVMRAITLIKLLLLVSMTAFIPTALESGSTGFVLTFCAIRIFMIFLWEWGAAHNSEIAPLTRQYTYGTIIGTVLLIASLWLSVELMLAMWVLATAIDSIQPMIMFMRRDSGQLSVSDHLPERFGLLFLIVLGESIISITFLLMDQNELFLRVIPSAILGLFLVFGIWWLYVDNIIAKPIRRDSAKHTMLWQQGHIWLAAVLPALGASISLLLKDIAAPQKSSILFIIVVLGALLFFMGFIERSLQPDAHSQCQCPKGFFLRLFAILTLILVVFIPSSLPSYVVFAVLNLIIWGQVFMAENLQFVQQQPASLQQA